MQENRDAPANGPAFVVSLDFEQHWGVYDHTPVGPMRSRLAGTRRAIPRILDRFERSEVRATWATVGLLLCQGRDEAIELYPEPPRYPALGTSIADVIRASGRSEAEDPDHYAPSLVERIAKTPGQEVATHTFSHYYCLERGGSVTEFERDLTAARRVAERRGIALSALVFPRNQYDREHVEAAARQGIRCFRGSPHAAVYRPLPHHAQGWALRLARLLDAHVTLVPSDRIVSRPQREYGLVNVPASRFLRPVTRLDRALARLRLRRILHEMSDAARTGADYHLWWHPHNFGVDTARNLAFLDRVLEHFHALRDRYGVTSMTMTEAATRA